MMNNICIDIDYSQLYKHGQKIGGDVFLLNRNFDKNRISATLSDGLGSGVKANVLASLTAHMGHKMSFSPIDLVHSAEIIMDTLPVDSEKGISYATFTIAQIAYSPDKDNIEVHLVEYDNPESLRFMGANPIEWEKKENKLNRKSAVREEIVLSSTFHMHVGDRLIFFSDGVAQAGVSLGTLPVQRSSANDLMGADGTKLMGSQPILPSARNAHNDAVEAKGWGVDSIREFIIKEIEKDPDISSRDLSRAIVTQAYSYDNYHCNDDTTCVVVHIRKPRRTLIVTGAPRTKAMDKELGDIIRTYQGNVIVCGGTTAKIVGRELDREIIPCKDPSGDLPPASIIEGIDLVTEGMVTLTRATDRLANKILLKNMPEDPAKEIIKIMRQTDQVEIIVGTQINEEADDPEMVKNFGVRIPLIARLKQALETNYLKEVEVRYM